MVNNRNYQMCSNCVMDTTDSKIVFDENGVCDHCNWFYKNILPDWKPKENNIEKLREISNKIKKHGKGKKYDCIIGLSGGMDSSYLVYIATEIMELRPLIYTVDTGWNLNVAVENIERVVRKRGLDLYTEVIDWEEMKDFQLSFLKSQVAYQDRPQDHAIFAGLYNFAIKNNIKFVLSGANNATELLRPPVEWVYFNDLKLMKDIHKKFGKIRLNTFPMCNIFKYRIYYSYIKGMKRIAPLDYVNYNKEEAEKILYDYYGWQKYENKHYENIFTRFYEGYFLPYKFGYDKRKCYFSNLILTGQMTREEAILELKKSPYDEKNIIEDMEYIAKKIGISLNELEKIINGENKTYKDYKNSFALIELSIKIAKLLGIEKRNFR